MLKNKWFMFIILCFSALVISINQFKVPPIIGELTTTYDVSVTQVTWLMSIFTIAGIILAIPSAMILSKLGAKKLGALVLMLLVIGNILGLFAPNFYILLISRAIEGISFAIILLVGMVLISGWFNENERAIPTGIFIAAPALGSTITISMGLPIANQFGWQTLWLIGGLLALIAFILFSLFVIENNVDNHEIKHDNNGLMLKSLKNIKIQMLAICIFCNGFLMLGFITLYPVIFGKYYGLDPQVANRYTSLVGLFGVITCTITGIVINKTKKAALMTFIAYFILAITLAFTFSLNDKTYAIHVIIFSIVTGIIITSVYALVPDSVNNPDELGHSVSIINLSNYLGIFVGSPLISAYVSNNNEKWESATPLIVGISSIAVISSLIYIYKTRLKVVKEV